MGQERSWIEKQADEQREAQPRAAQLIEHAAIAEELIDMYELEDHARQYRAKLAQKRGA